MNLHIESFVSRHKRSQFDCGVDSLNIYVQTQIGQDVKKHAAAAYVLVDGERPEILGFYTLSMMNLKLADLPDSIQKGLPRYPQVPAVLLGRLAIDNKLRGTGAGAVLLRDALLRCQQSGIAWTAMVVDAINESAAGFYRRFGFQPLPDQPNRLFVLQKTLIMEIGSSY